MQCCVSSITELPSLSADVFYSMIVCQVHFFVQNLTSSCFSHGIMGLSFHVVSVWHISINSNHVSLWPTVYTCRIKCRKPFKLTDFWWYAQVSLIYLPHVCPWKNHSLSLCAGKCSGHKAWNVKLYHHQAFFPLRTGPNCLFLLVYGSVCVWVCACLRQGVHL